MDVQWLCGMIDGDGSVSLNLYDRSNGRKNISHQVRITTETESSALVVKGIYNSLGVNPYIFHESKRWFRITVQKRAHLIKILPTLIYGCVAKKRQAEALFSAISDNSLDSYIKESTRIRDLNKTGVSRGRLDDTVPVPSVSYIAGLVDSDGSFALMKNHKVTHPRFTFDNVDARLISSFESYLKSIGCKYSMFLQKKRGKNWSRCYRISIYDSLSQKMFIDSIYDHLVTRKDKAASILENIDLKLLNPQRLGVRCPTG